MTALKNWIMQHPNLSAWFVLALGMDIILIVEARDVGLEGSQWFWLLLITTLVAGACIWIISWGGDDEETADESVVDESVVDRSVADRSVNG